MHRRTFQNQLAAVCGSLATLGAMRGSSEGAERSKGARTTNPIGVSILAIHDAGKTRPRHKLHDLRKQRFAHVHLSPQVV